MAKGKHSTALFEVIARSKGIQTPAKSAPARKASSGSSPWGWLFSKRKSAAAAPASPVVSAATSRGGSTSGSAAASGKTPVVVQVQRAATGESPAADSSHGYYPAPASAYPAPVVSPETDADPDATGLDLPEPAESLAVKLEPDRRQIAMRMSYTTAIIGAFAVTVVIFLAIVVGQHLSRSPNSALGGSRSESLRTGPANAQVMNVPRRTPAAAPVPAATPIKTPQPRAPLASEPAYNEPRPPASLISRDPQRTIGLNYVVVQSYAQSELKLANDACEFLSKNGVPCTVEHDIAGWGKKLVVVGTFGFTGLSTPEYREYIARIGKLSAQFAPGRNSYKSFQPTAKKWDKALAASE